MKFALGIVTHTAIWAWILLAYLIWQGIKAMGPRTTAIGRALIVPAIFIVLGLVETWARPARQSFTADRLDRRGAGADAGRRADAAAV
jgi:hypothetical protein